MKVVLRGSHGGELDDELVRVNHRNPDRDISAAVVRLANRCTLVEGDVITVEGERE